MKNHSECPTQFIGVAEDAHTTGVAGVRRQEATVQISNDDVKKLKDRGHFFRNNLKTCSLVHLLMHSHTHSLVNAVVAYNGCRFILWIKLPDCECIHIY